ncbi:MAG: ABC transporter substrate-binding protein, partial [Pseudodonghicola sp.]
MTRPRAAMAAARAIPCAQRRPHARAVARSLPDRTLAAVALALLMLLAWTGLLAAEEEKIIKSYGFSEFGALKYPEGFAHFDYVNPDAPKGGELSYAAQGTFDNFNPFTRQGRAAAR